MDSAHEAFRITGGVRIAWANASAPLAKLTADESKIVLKVSVLGTYTFCAEEVVALERYSIIPVIAAGVRIVHANSKYPRNVIFFSLKQPDAVLEGIRASGFEPKAPESSLEVFKTRRGLPVKTNVIIAALLLWNVAFFLMVYWPPLALLGPLIFLIASITAFRSLNLQRAVLKPGRHFEEIQAWVAIIRLVVGFLLVVWAIIFAALPEMRKPMIHDRSALKFSAAKKGAE